MFFRLNLNIQSFYFRPTKTESGEKGKNTMLWRVTGDHVEGQILFCKKFKSNFSCQVRGLIEAWGSISSSPGVLQRI